MASTRNFFRAICLFLLFFSFADHLHAKKQKTKEELKAEKKIGKNILDYNEADVHKLLDQWNEDEDDSDEDFYDDDDPRREEIKRKGINLDPTKYKDDPMSLLKMAKKDKVLMMFVNVAGTSTKQESEKITQRWQQSLFNAHFQLQRFMVADNRAIFMVQDGSTAWDIKDFLIQQPECEMVEFDNQKFPGPGASSEERKKTEL